MSNRNQLFQDGYIFLSAYRPGEDETTVAASLGSLLALGDGPSVHPLVPLRKEAATPNTYSGIYGLERFPFHTDLAHWRLPPRYLLLRCEIGFKEVPTLLADGYALAHAAGVNVLTRTLVQPRRPVGGKLPLLRVYQTIQDERLLRWDEVFFRPASEVGEVGVEKFRDAIGSCTPLGIPLVSRGDTLVIDNWRMLHARSAIPTGCESRILKRAYLGNVN